jgi:hypothetical protein
MDIQQIRNRIDDGIARGDLLFKAEDFENALLRSLLDDHCGGSLRLVKPDKLRDEENVVEVSGKLGSSFVNQTGLDVSIELTVEQERLELRATFSGFDASWRFSHSFADTAGTLLEELEFQDVRFTLDSRPGEALDAGFPARFGYSVEPAGAAESASPALSFQATVPEGSLSEPLRAAALPEDGGSPTLSGPVVRQDGRTKALLTAAEEGEIAVPPHKLRSRFQLISLLDYEAGRERPRTVVLGGLSAELAVELEGQSLNLPFLSLFIDQKPYLFDLSSRLTEFPKLSLEAAGLLLGGATSLPALPPEFPSSETLQLAEVGYELLAATRELRGAQVTLALRQEWRPVGDWLRLYDFRLRFLMAGETLIGAAAFCKAEIAGKVLEGHVGLPDLDFSLALARGERIELKKLAESTLRLPVPFPQLDCTELTLSGNVRAGEHAFLTSVQTPWVVPCGPLSLSMEGVRLLVACSGGKTPKASGTLTGWFNLGGNRLFGRATCEGAREWRFEAGTEPGEAFQAKPFLRLLQESLGITLPPYLKEPRIDSLGMALTLDTGGQAFDLTLLGENGLRFEEFGATGLTLGLTRFALNCSSKGENVDWEVSATTVLGLGEKVQLTGKLGIVKAGAVYTLTVKPENEEIPAGEEPRLSEVLKALLPQATRLPEGLPDVALTRYGLEVASDGSGHVEMGFQGAEPWTLGNARLMLGSLRLRFERTATKDVQCRIEAGGCAGKISPDVGFQKGKLDFTWKGKDDWEIGGGIEVTVFEQSFDLSAQYVTENGGRKLRLETSTASDKPLLQIPQVLELTPRSLALEIEKDSDGTSWQMTAGASLKVYEFVTGQANPLLDLSAGTLRFETGRDETSLGFEAKEGATLSLKLFEHAGGPMLLKAGLEKLTLTRKETWRFSADAQVELTGVPQPLGVLERKVRGGIEVDGQGVKILVHSLGEPLPFKLPQTGGVPIDLGQGAVDIRDLFFYAGSKDGNGGKLEIGGELWLGLPSRLNHIFGEKDGEPSLRVFRTYLQDAPEKEREESFLRFKISGGTEGLSGELGNSPIVDVPYVEIKDGWLFLDLCDKKEWHGTAHDFGRLSLQLPKLVLDLDGGAFRFAGGFRIDKDRGFRIPLGPLKSLLAAVNLPMAAEALPAGIPVQGLDLFDQKGNLRTSEFLAFLQRMGLPVPAELSRALQEAGHVADRLPDRFKHYLNITIPDQMLLSIEVTPDASVRINFRTSQDKPLKMLLPLPPGLVGIELTSLSFGEAWGGALFTLDLDARIDHFDLLTLAASLVLPFDQLKEYLHESGRVLHQSFFLEELFLFIVYQTGIPIPVPLFCKHLGMSYLGLEGAEVQSHFRLPRPRFNLVEALALVAELNRFFTTDQLFRLESVPKSMNLVFTVGPNYLRLPKYLARSEQGSGQGYLLGIEKELPPLNTLKLVAALLNAAKRRSINDLLQQADLDSRVQAVTLNLFGFLQLHAAYALVTPAEFVERASERFVKVFEEQLRLHHPKAPLPARAPAEEILALVPARSALELGGRPESPRVRKDTEGVVALVKGAVHVADTVVLDTFFGLAAVDGSGFGAGVSFRGRVANLVDLSLWGALAIAPKGERKLRIAGHAHFRLREALILQGDFEVSEDRLRILGLLDLFPETVFPGFPLRIYSSQQIEGELSASKFLFGGGIQLKLGSLSLGGTIDLGPDRILLNLNWGKARAVLLVEDAGGTLRIQGNMTALEFSKVLRVSAREGGGGPKLLVEVKNRKLSTCHLDGEVCFLGISTALTFAYRTSENSLFLEHSASSHSIGYKYQLAIRGSSHVTSELEARLALKQKLSFGSLGSIDLSVQAETRFLIEVSADKLTVKAGLRFQWQGETFALSPLDFEVAAEELQIQDLPSLAARLLVKQGNSIFTSVFGNAEKWAALAAKGAITGVEKGIEGVLREVFKLSPEDAKTISNAAIRAAKTACPVRTAASCL